MQPVFHFRTDTVSNLLYVLMKDQSDQSKVLIRLLKMILKCKNINDILSNLSTNTNTQETVTSTSRPETNNSLKDVETHETKQGNTRTHETKQENTETKDTDTSDNNLYSDHTVTISELESAFENEFANMHRNEHSIKSLFYHYNDDMYTFDYFA